MPAPARDPGRTAFSEALSAAIAGRGLTLERLSHRLEASGLRTSTATLSYWQTGRSLPTRTRSLEAVAELERMLGLRPNQLLDTLPGDAVSRWDPFDHLVPEKDLVPAVLAQMGLDQARRPRNRVLHDSVLVAADRATQRATSRQVVEAIDGPVDRMGLVFRRNGLDEQAPFVEGSDASPLGQVVELEDAGLVVAELLLPRPLQPGELAMVAYHVTWDIRAEDEPGFNRAITADIDYAVLEVAFAGEPPLEVGHLYIPNTTQAADVEQRVDTVLQPAAFVQHVLVDPQPGMHGMAWAYRD